MLIHCGIAIQDIQLRCDFVEGVLWSPFEVAFIPGGFMDAVAFEFGKEFGDVRDRPCLGGVDYHTSICMAFGEKVELSAYLTCKGVALWWKKLPVFPNGFVSWVDSCNVFCFRVIHVEVLGLKVCHKSVNDQTCFHTLVVSLCFFSTYHCQLRDPHGSSAVLQDVCVLSSKKGFIKYCLQQLGRLKCHHMS